MATPARSLQPNSMAEFHLPTGMGQPAYPQYQQPVATSGVEWYSAGSSSHHYAQQSYGYDVHATGSVGAAYGSFDDEPPLLEGGLAAAAGGRRLRLGASLLAPTALSLLPASADSS